ncbi:MAG: hypothetical protein KF863_10870 [Rubrivivax sp.]|nr:hypothetical protein [Rubrivivax sp.]
MPTTEPTPTAAPKRKRAAPPPPWTEAELIDAFTAALPSLGAIAAGRKRAWRWPEGGAVAEVGDVAEHEGRLFVAWAITAIAPPSRCSWIEVDADDLAMARKAYEARQQREAQREAQRREAALAHRVAVAEAQGRIEAAHKAASEGRALVDADALQAQVRDLTQRLLELEATALHEAGIYRAGTDYRAGALVTHRSGLWVSKTSTNTEPGQAASDWRLVMKAGKR